jgi:hypothetical protein
VTPEDHKPSPQPPQGHNHAKGKSDGCPTFAPAWRTQGEIGDTIPIPDLTCDGQTEPDHHACSHSRQPRQRDHRDVIILAKRNRGFGGLRSIRTRSKKRLQPFEAEDLAGGHAGL